MHCVQTRRDFLALKKKMAGKGVFDKDTAQAIYTGLDNLAKLSCNFCLNKEDFTKVYGMTPAEYLTKEIIGSNIAN